MSRELKIGPQANPNPPWSNQKASLERGNSQQLSDKNMRLVGKTNKLTGNKWSYESLMDKQKADDAKVKKTTKIGPNSRTPKKNLRPAKHRINASSGEMEAY